MFGNFMDKLNEMKQKAEESKKRLDTIYVKGESPDKSVTVTMNGNRVVKSINFSDGFFSKDQEEIEDMLVIAVNKALENAEKVYEAEMQSAAKNILPNMPF
ncbi:MAG: YbaB/EbfC family nucleoid-associated protein [Bacteroidetes bacterium]|jgi:hypothetical protein|nr:MAG: YbaB/EbfC family nucleoid-associated protein [Bacteroidota bacterium]